jgi:TRAP-type C4-dicarboxylate transport system substrate-binding protein
MDVLTASALAELKELGLEFYEVDKSLFREKVEEVYRKNAAKVGGMAKIEEVIKQ